MAVLSCTIILEKTREFAHETGQRIQFHFSLSAHGGLTASSKFKFVSSSAKIQNKQVLSPPHLSL